MPKSTRKVSKVSNSGRAAKAATAPIRRKKVV